MLSHNGFAHILLQYILIDNVRILFVGSDLETSLVIETNNHDSTNVLHPVLNPEYKGCFYWLFFRFFCLSIGNLMWNSCR